MRYIVSYDLISASENEYQRLYDALEKLGGKRVLWSQWVVKHSNITSERLRDHILQFMDQNKDRLLVTELDGAGWASWNALIDLSKF